jgi:hypothetical protein
MRIEAHIAKTTNRLEVRMLRTQRDRAEKMRKAVTASRYGGSFDGGMSFRFYYPLSVEKCQEMRDAWGADLKVHAALADWYRTAHKARVQHVALAAQTDAELPVVAARYPKLNAWLKGDQRVTAAWIANAYRGGGLLADEVGTGKTAGVVAGLVEAGITGPTLIVCPKISVRAVWLRELKQHTDLPVYACSGTRAKREKELAAYLEDPSPFKVLIIVAEMLRIKAHRAKGRVEEFFGYGYPELFEVDWTRVTSCSGRWMWCGPTSRARVCER